jgi:kelch-like protein 17 (actinfilin)/kelch-like protein 20
MGTAREHSGVATLGGKLYAVGGGNDDDGRLSSAEVFDLETQTWTPIASMSFERKFVMVAAVQGKLYAAGGDGIDGSPLTSAEAYDPQQYCWEVVANTGCVHDIGAMVAI